MLKLIPCPAFLEYPAPYLLCQFLLPDQCQLTILADLLDQEYSLHSKHPRCVVIKLSQIIIPDEDFVSLVKIK